MATANSRMRHNFIVLGIDFAFFGMALGFINPYTVLPAFVTRLGASDALVGLLVTVFYLAWDLPQLAAGNIIARHPRKKPTLLRMAFLGRPVVFGFALLLFVTGGEPTWLVVALLMLVLAILFSTDAFAAIAWFDILGRAFPSERRGGFLSIWQAFKAAGVIGVASVAAYILSERGPEFPYNYALLFTLGGVGLLVSALALTFVHEPALAEDEPASTQIAWRDFGPHLLHSWRNDSKLRLITISRILIRLATMASAFYVLYATQVLHFPIETIGLFILGQNLGALGGSLLLGRITDRFGPRRAIQVGALFVLSAPMLALAMALSSAPIAQILRQLYLWIYICIGMTENVVILGYLNYILDSAPPGQRTIYMGASNAISGLGVLGPLFAGWLLSLSTYPVLFGVAAIFAVVAVLIAFRLPDSRIAHSAGDSPLSTGTAEREA